MSKRELIERSIEAMFALLKEVQANPASYLEDTVILKALKSQGGVCKLDYAFTSGGRDYHIKPLSLNTVKQKLDSSITVEDFHYLNKQRSLANEAVTKFTHKPSKERARTKAGLEDTVQELKDYIDTLHATTDVLLQALWINRRDFKTIRDTQSLGLRQQRIDAALQRMSLILSLNPEPFNGVGNPVDRKHLRVVTNE